MFRRNKLPRFSSKYESFQEWFGSSAPSPYRDRIERLHAIHPTATISQLRGHPKSSESPLREMVPTEIWKRSWDQLTPKEAWTRRKALKVLSLMRRKELSLTKACKKVHIHPKTVLSNIDAFVREGPRWRPKAWDKIKRVLVVNEHGSSKYLQIEDSRHATHIGRYHWAVREFLRTGDETFLKPFRGKWVRDAQENKHYLDTDPERLYEIKERREDPEFYTIYREMK